jgi:hypothetical protein
VATTPVVTPVTPYQFNPRNPVETSVIDAGCRAS